jgi:hypothetical protein
METSLPCHRASEAVKTGVRDLSARLLKGGRTNSRFKKNSVSGGFSVAEHRNQNRLMVVERHQMVADEQPQRLTRAPIVAGSHADRESLRVLARNRSRRRTSSPVDEREVDTRCPIDVAPKRRDRRTFSDSAISVPTLLRECLEYVIFAEIVCSLGARCPRRRSSPPCDLDVGAPHPGNYLSAPRKELSVGVLDG